MPLQYGTLVSSTRPASLLRLGIVVCSVLVFELLSSTIASAAPAPRRQARLAARILCETRGVRCTGVERVGYGKTFRDTARQASCFKQIHRLLHRPTGTWLGRSRPTPLQGHDL